MELKYYVVDAFAEKPFSGNPAGVCLLDEWLPEALLQNIAAENNLSETAFLVKTARGYDLRWFTPELEIDLCGHATLASGFVINKYVDQSAARIDFMTKSGPLSVSAEDGWLEMDFPSRPPEPAQAPAGIIQALGAEVLEAHFFRDLILLLPNRRAVAELRPDHAALSLFRDYFGFIVTAAGEGGEDFVSRYFAPGAGIAEDPVTGSAHCALAPFWAARLGKTELVARQLSKRGGLLKLRAQSERVLIKGQARLYMEGSIFI